ncbi:hypothetical protein M514_12367 [Trichuris suis]|uniref:Uncharacterized protein n=1 Tax=Trichuris suis TaxID=68888 RepID=A0A085LP44_9BILA|nr:hypothetical protein M513_12367 [Trichuris suis]KFD60644.1 hypothetical protein M514_12367 [Trichuris suis]
MEWQRSTDWVSKGKDPPGPFLEPMSVLEIGTKGPGVVRGDNLSAVSPRELCPGVTSPAATVRQRLRRRPGPFVQPISAREIGQSELGSASAHEPLPGGADYPEVEKHWYRANGWTAEMHGRQSNSDGQAVTP